MIFAVSFVMAYEHDPEAKLESQLRMERAAAAGIVLGDDSNLTGLSTAYLQMETEQARINLERNLEGFATALGDRFRTLYDVEVLEVNGTTGAVTLQATEDVKFFWVIHGKATSKFEISEGVIKERAPWYAVFYVK